MNLFILLGTSEQHQTIPWDTSAECAEQDDRHAVFELDHSFGIGLLKAQEWSL